MQEEYAAKLRPTKAAYTAESNCLVNDQHLTKNPYHCYKAQYAA